MKADEQICALWKRPLALACGQVAKSSNIRCMTEKPSSMPMSGEVKSGITTLRSSPPHSTVSSDAVKTIVEPTSDPMSACDELEGMPFHQVKRSQAMAPSRAVRTT